MVWTPPKLARARPPRPGGAASGGAAPNHRAPGPPTVPAYRQHSHSQAAVRRMNKNVIHQGNVISAVIHKKMNQIHMAAAAVSHVRRTYLHRKQRRAAAAAEKAPCRRAGAHFGAAATGSGAMTGGQLCQM